ncbi:MAG: hypothetical protein WED07_16605 [Candidatus Freyarchaeum deiterrae]
MRSVSHQVELSEEEIEIMVGTLRYALEYCPVESISHKVDITNEKIEDLIAKLEKALKPR